MTLVDSLTKELEEAGSHLIVQTEWANKSGKPFGIIFKTEQFKPDGDPKGPLNECAGVSTFDIAARIANAVGAKRGDFFGRGTQFRDDIRASREALK